MLKYFALFRSLVPCLITTNTNRPFYLTMYIHNNTNDTDNNELIELFSQKAPVSRFDDDIPSEITIERPEENESETTGVVELSPELALPRIKTYLDLGTPVRLTVTGSSMMPFLHDRRDSVVLAPVKRRLKVGDIIFYLRDGNSPVLHRIIKVISPKEYLCCADAQNTTVEVSRSQVIAVVSDIERRGVYTSCASVSWQLRSRIWMGLMPLRPRLLRMILSARHFLRKK